MVANQQFSNTRLRRVRAPAVGGSATFSFVHALEARPRRVAFDLEEATAPWPEDAPWQGGTRLRRFRGHVEDVEPNGDVVTRLGEIPSGRVLLAVLCEKLHDRRVEGIEADYIALEVPDAYVYGYGMDYHEQGRNLPGIYALEH